MNIWRPLSIGLILGGLSFLGACGYAQSGGSGTNQIYGGFWEIGPAVSTDLTLEAVGQPVSATVIAYSSGGAQVAAQAVSLEADQSTHIGLANLVPGGGRGGLAVEWSGGGQVRGVVSITGDNGISASYQLQGGNRFDTQNTVYAPWYLPDSGTGGTLSLFNSGPAATQVGISAIVGGTKQRLQTVSLPPYTEQALDLKTILEDGNLSQANMGAIVLNYTGPAHSLQPVLFLESASTGFALMPTFAAQHAQPGGSQTVWHFPEVPLPIVASGASSTATNMTSYALVSNGTGQQVAAQVRSYAVVNRQSVQQNLNVPTLEPYETRLINLGTSGPPWLSVPNAQLTGAAASGTRFNPAGITVTHSGVPGDVAVTIFTVGADGETVGTSDGIVLPTQATDVGYLNAALSNPIEYVVKNASASTEITLYYQNLLGVGSFTAALPQAAKPANKFEQTIKPDGTIDLSAAFQPGSTDLNGNVLPAGTREGMLVLSMSAPSPTATSAAQPNCTSPCAATQSPSVNMTASTAQSASVAEPAFGEVLMGPTPCLYTTADIADDCISNTTVDVYVGQQISIDAEMPYRFTLGYGPVTQEWLWSDPSGDQLAPLGLTVGCSSSFSYTGTPCSGTNILNASNTTGFQPSNFPLPDRFNPNGSADSTGSNYTFYWTAPPTSGDYTLYYQYSYNSGGDSPNMVGYAYVTFNVTAPTVTEYVCGGNVGSSACNSTNNGSLGTTIVNSSGHLGFGDQTTGGANFGIQFTASTADVSGGNLIFAQIVSPATFSFYTSDGSKYCTATLVPASTPTLDNSYPYPRNGSGSSPLTTDDNPEAAFPSPASTYPKVTTDYHLTMYTLWEPTVGPTSLSVTNPIPVPTGYVPWYWDGVGTYSGGTWAVSVSSTAHAYGFTVSSTYPSWNSAAINGEATCYP